MRLNLEDLQPLELKPLPNHVEYAYLGDNDTLLVFISKSLTSAEKGHSKVMLKRLNASGILSTLENFV